MKQLMLICLIFTSPLLLAKNQNDFNYQAMLDEYLKKGEMNSTEVQTQKEDISAQKKMREQLKNQARDVASTLKKDQNILKLENPEIEISTK